MKRPTTRLLVPLTIALGAGVLLVTEAAMKPSSADRASLYLVFGSVALGALVVGWAISRRARRFRSLRLTLQVVAVAAVLVAGTAVGASAVSMFLDAHDLRLVLVALALGVSLGVVLAVSVTASLTADLDRLAETVVAVGHGDLAIRTGMDRRDEIGETARQVDAMIDRLADAEAQRAKDESARREFLAAVSHDLRTPLAAMQAALEAVEDGVAEDPARYLASMSHHLEVLSTLVDDLAVLASVEAGGVRATELVDLAELADEAVEALTAVAVRKKVGLAVRAEGTLKARGDAAALGRVLRNLLDNALRYAPEGSAVTVAVGNGGEGITVAVSDEGVGFDPALKERAFERFVTGDPARTHGGGSGLGLSIAKSVVEAHGGSIWIDPIEDGRGSTVAFTVPGTRAG